jgi:hypothetical protein
MNITVTRNGQQFGPYTLEQTNAYLVSGQLSHADLALQEGASQWTPLSTILGIAAPPPPPFVVSERSIGKLIWMAIIWFVAFWCGTLILVGAIAGSFNSKDATNAGIAAVEALGGSGIFFLIALCLSVGLTIAGKLPGTKKGRSPADPATDPIRVFAEAHRKFTIRVLITIGVQLWVCWFSPNGGLLFLLMSGVQLWLIHDMAKAFSLQNSLVWVIGTCIPFIGFFVLLALSMKGTSRLRAAGVKVGFFGAQLPPRII